MLYAINGQNSQSMTAYNYAQEVYDKIIQDNSNAKIYVTGHSLGAYLAQIGGAAIVDKEAGITSSPEEREVLKFNSSDGIESKLNKYKDTYYKEDSHLEQVAYFNGMGVTPMFVSNKFATNVNNALIYLSTHGKNGERLTSNRKVTYSDEINSSGRLVLYSIDGDPISSLGFHYGEVFKLDYAADAVTNHENHSFKTLLEESESSLYDITNKKISDISDITVEDINNLIEKININKDKLTEGLSKISSLFIDIQNISDEIINNRSGDRMPEFITQLDSRYENYVPLFNISNVINNFFAYISDENHQTPITERLNSNELLKAFGLLEYANVNHETDSFVCMIDHDNGVINNSDIELKMDTKNMDCEENICQRAFLNNYVTDYKINENVSNYDNGTNSYVKLSVNLEKGCARGYRWEYKIGAKGTWQGISFGGTANEPLDETYKNEIIVPKDIIQEGISNKIYFRVWVFFGNKFKEMKTQIVDTNVSDRNAINFVAATDENDKEITFSTNPTLNDNIYVGSNIGKAWNGYYFSIDQSFYVNNSKNEKYYIKLQ